MKVRGESWKWCCSRQFKSLKQQTYSITWTSDEHILYRRQMEKHDIALLKQHSSLCSSHTWRTDARVPVLSTVRAPEPPSPMCWRLYKDKLLRMSNRKISASSERVECFSVNNADASKSNWLFPWSGNMAQRSNVPLSAACVKDMIPREMWERLQWEVRYLCVHWCTPTMPRVWQWVLKQLFCLQSIQDLFDVYIKDLKLAAALHLANIASALRASKAMTGSLNVQYKLIGCKTPQTYLG